MKQFITVYPGADKTKLLLTRFIGDITNSKDEKVAELLTNWTSSTIMVEVEGDTFALDTEKFVHYIMKNHKKLLREEMKRRETRSLEDIQES